MESIWPRLLWSGARLWNKKVNLLLVWFVGYECFLPPLFYGSQSVAFKGTERFKPKGIYLHQVKFISWLFNWRWLFFFFK